MNYKNIVTGVELTEQDYRALIEAKASHAFREYLDSFDNDEDEEEFDYSSFLDKMYESDTDFIQIEE